MLLVSDYSVKLELARWLEGYSYGLVSRGLNSRNIKISSKIEITSSPQYRLQD